ncbi:MAG: U3 small nucleolar RNA-associated protein 13 [Thelocarpon superellum]|nr:MAG: U3 small nucleolar RNA-associated protein 13 [Thelocarpon superellum]
MLPRGQSKTTFEAHKVIQPIYTGGSVALDQTGHTLATCLGEDAVITHLQTGEQLAYIEGDGELITSLALTPSASHLILCSRSLSMRIFALDTSALPLSRIITTLQRTLKPHPSPVIVTAIDSTGTLLGTGGADNVIKVWDIRGGYVTHTFHGHTGLISALHFFEGYASPRTAEGVSHRKKSKQYLHGMREDGAEPATGFRLASGSEDGKVRVWDLGKRKCTAVLESHVSIVRTLDYSAEEQALLSAGRDKTMIVWDSKSWKSRKVVPVLEGVESAGFMSDGKIIYTGGEHGRIRLWAADTGREMTEEQAVGGEGENVVDILHLPNLHFLLSVHGDQTLGLYSLGPIAHVPPGSSLPALTPMRRISGTHDEIIDLAYLTPERSLLALATNSEDIRIISVSSSSTSPQEDTLGGGQFFGADVALLKGHDEIVISLDVDWSGCWLATGAKDNTARLWRIDSSALSFTCVATFQGHAESLGAIALPKTIPSADSPAFMRPLDHPPPFLLSGSQDRTIKCWDIQSVKQAPRARYTRKAHEKDINAIDINHTSTLFASASQDRNVKIWTVEEGEVQGILRGHRRGVWSVRFAPKDSPTITSDKGPTSSRRGLVLTGSGDKTVKIWSLSDFSCLLTLEGHTNSVLKVLWLPPSPNSPPSQGAGAQVASAGGDGLVKVWEVSSSDAACTLDNHTDRVWALSVDPTTRTLVSGGGDGVITFWADTSRATASASAQATSARIEQEQALDNLTRAGAYREAITLALALEHPGRLLSLFTAVAGTMDPSQAGSISGMDEVDEVLGHLAPHQLVTLLKRLRDWNTNARTAPIAQRILRVLVRCYPAETLAGLGGRRAIFEEDEVEEGGDLESAEERTKGPRRTGQKGEMKPLIDALRAYTERHYKRLEDLIEESFLIDYTLREMDERD